MNNKENTKLHIIIKVIMKKILIKILFITTITSCNIANEKKYQENEAEKDKHPLQNMPTNNINAWSDECGFSFELHTNSIWAFGSEIIKYERLNDSIFNITYPENVTIIKDVKIESYENKRYISFSNSGLSCCLDQNKNEIIFGADRLKFQKIANNSIKIFFPKKSSWNISRISDREIYIYNKKNRVKYTEFND